MAKKNEAKVFDGLIAAVKYDPHGKVYEVKGKDTLYHVTASSPDSALAAVAEHLGFKAELVKVNAKFQATVEALTPPKTTTK